MTSYQANGYDLVATKTTASAAALTMATEAFLDRVARKEMPPCTDINVTVMRALVNHDGILSTQTVEEILQFFEKEKSNKDFYKPTLDATWRVLGWRPGQPLEPLWSGARLDWLHQFLDVIQRSPRLRRDATYLDRALHAIYTHPVFGQLYHEESLRAVRDRIESTLLTIEGGP